MPQPRTVLDSFSLDGRVALVTGASSGLGREIAQALASAGATILLTARRESPLRDLVREHGGTYFCGDLQQSDTRDELVRWAIGQFGQIDVLVNNAGMNNPINAEEDSDQSFRDNLEINLVAPYALSRLVGSHMLTRGRGSIINIASIFGLVGVGKPPSAAYAASKGGIVNLTRELAVQWARRGVRVNAIAPGFFPTEMTEGIFNTEEGLRWMTRRTPMGRGGQRRELDGCVIFLASDASSYVTGHVLTVDGGWTAI